MGNIWKTGILMAALTVLLILIGRLIGGTQGAILAFVFALILNFAAYWFSDKIVLAMYGGKEVNSTQAPELCGIMQDLASRMDLPMPKIYIIPSPSPNAFATGRDPAHSSVAVTEGNLRILSKDELEAVMAHEMTHIKNRDTLIATVVAALAGAVTMLARFAGFSAFYGGRDSDDNRSGGLFILVYLIAPIAALLIQLAISRSREYMADEGSGRVTGKPMNLATALRKLVESAKQMPMPAEPSTAHLFIVSPFNGGGITAMFSTHPPIEKRIEKLKSLTDQITNPHIIK
jgi:heat shock protein HtpX